MGQHRPGKPTIYQLIRKKSQTPSAENQHSPLLNQGNQHLIASLWDACEMLSLFKPQTGMVQPQ